MFSTQLIKYSLNFFVFKKEGNAYLIPFHRVLWSRSTFKFPLHFKQLYKKENTVRKEENVDGVKKRSVDSLEITSLENRLEGQRVENDVFQS